VLESFFAALASTTETKFSSTCDAGLDLETGKVASMSKNGVVEPGFVNFTFFLFFSDNFFFFI
jgi:hypothetical protein